MPEPAEHTDRARIPLGAFIRKVTRGLVLDYLGIKTLSVNGYLRP